MRSATPKSPIPKVTTSDGFIYFFSAGAPVPSAVATAAVFFAIKKPLSKKSVGNRNSAPT